MGRVRESAGGSPGEGTSWRNWHRGARAACAKPRPWPQGGARSGRALGVSGSSCGVGRCPSQLCGGQPEVRLAGRSGRLGSRGHVATPGQGTQVGGMPS